MSDISREACERQADLTRRYGDKIGVPEMILALRAAIDAAEADKRQAVLDERERCKGLVDVISGRLIALPKSALILLINA